MRILVLLLMLFPLVSFAGTKSHHRHHTHKKSPIAMTTRSIEVQMKRFAKTMASKHNFDEQETYAFLVSVQPNRDVFRFFTKHASKRFTPEELDHLREMAKLRVDHGVEFWNANRQALSRAEKQYGVPAEIIVGLIGIETNYGNYLGKFKEHEVLVTLSFYGNYRRAYFQTQLEHFLLLSKQYNWDKTNIPCSYAGAIGIPQFMPDNMKPYAVDWNNDGQIDLMDPSDAIGSVANFLSQHGWVSGEPIATKTNKRIRGKTFVLRTLPGPEPSTWKREKNFNVIRQYNPLNSYVMSIFILSTKVKDEMKHQPDVDTLDYVQIVVPTNDDGTIEQTSPQDIPPNPEHEGAESLQ